MPIERVVVDALRERLPIRVVGGGQRPARLLGELLGVQNSLVRGSQTHARLVELTSAKRQERVDTETKRHAALSVIDRRRSSASE